MGANSSAIAPDHENYRFERQSDERQIGLKVKV